MSDWGAGYVTDITYVTGCYRQQSPSIMVLACLLGGVDVPMPGPEDPVSYLELGCGNGLGAMMLAASNPLWKVTAIDFNPAHIAMAREWAADAQLRNIEFLEADLASLAENAAIHAVPMADFVSMHGVWSWVPPAVRTGIVRLLSARLRPGGALHVSYNALPAWGATLGMQKLLRSVGRQRVARSDHQVEEGFRFLRDLIATDPPHLRQVSLIRTLLERIDDLPTIYLAHEYMNASWAPCFMADVAEALSAAKLEWAGSASLVENFPDLVFTADQRALVNRYDDPLLRELIKDHCLERVLRHDVYVRGARRLTPRRRDELLSDMSLVLNVSADEVPMHADVPAGRADLNPGFYQPIAAAITSGPRKIRDLLALPAIVGRRNNPAELIGMLVGAELADIALRPGDPPSTSAQRLNAVAARRLLQTEPVSRPVTAATTRLGTPAPARVLDLLIASTLAEGGGMDEVLTNLARSITITDEAKLREVLAQSIEHRLPPLRAAGVL